MLARGILCRLAADVPKTPTPDLSQLAHLLQRSILARNAVGIPSVCALSHAYKTALAISRRSYATARATKPTKTVKKAVKKSAAKKAAPKKKTATKKPKKKAARATKAKPKKKVAATPKRKVKKSLTPGEKEKATIKELKAKALREPSNGQHMSAWMVFSGEAVKGKTGGNLTGSVKDAAARFKNLTPAEKEHYNHLANERAAAQQAEYKRWVLSHTPEQIRIANLARLNLRRRVPTTAGKRKYPPHTSKIKDDRQVKRPSSAYLRFATERNTSGDMKSIAKSEVMKLIGNEWNALSASEKQKYEDAYTAEKQAFRRDYEKTYGHKLS
ncbi:uncharacterized protein BDR25DRAFT_221485 [Lindgomyces ingoldianus]|uniref:Uncharacterized protein n=1 Tax=Lindgomyces ingoldianus TaxID=673940 RepID=A0ACB6QYN6_9PLEO|nr:uncharacterized protein BDR25DRAFT_221485 [Lindgomyces ingoldianus]KAF2472001.1 hypothetical protein BDR25DRAFT_221485 [Lindgomyces ingoldianus]